MIVGFNVYHAPEGSAESFCGFVAVENGDVKAALAECWELAEAGRALPESLYETARAAGHVCGMAAPDKSREAEEPYDWFGPDGCHCAMPVYAPHVEITAAGGTTFHASLDGEYLGSIEHGGIDEDGQWVGDDDELVAAVRREWDEIPSDAEITIR